MFNKILHTTSLKANLIANFVGNSWAGLIGLIFIPIYLKYIGVEGYGLIGIFASLQIVLSLFDSGLSTTLNKEISRLSVLPNTQQQMRNLVKTLGNVYWFMALIAGAIALCVTPFLAKHWVKPKELSVETITYAFVLMSISIVFQFPSGFYSGGLLGLQRQVMLNVLRITFATLKSVGAIIVLLFLSRSIEAFFAWALFVTILQTFVYRYFLWFYLPKSEKKAVHDKQELKNIRRFATGMTIIGITSVLLTQIDKIILSKILLLEQFGYYTFAFTVGSISYMIAMPISQSYFPKFSALLAEGKINELNKIYHQACQLLTLLVVPFALFLSIFSKEILFIWTHNSNTVMNTWKITSVVSLAVAIHCLMLIPYMLCLTYGNTKIALYTNIVLLIALIPGTIFSSFYFGGLGGAVCWLIVTIVYLFVNPILIHKFFLKGQAFNWYWHDTFKPIIKCVVLFFLSRLLLFNINFNIYITTFLLIVIGVSGFCLTIYSCKELKNIFFQKLGFNSNK